MMDTDNPNYRFIYPIAKNAVGDDYGEYVYACPVPVPVPIEELWCADCWLVNLRGEEHPGYSQSPIPVLTIDLGNPIPRVLV